MNMKTISNVGSPESRKTGELKAAYKFDYSKAQPNRFAGRRAAASVSGTA